MRRAAVVLALCSLVACGGSGASTTPPCAPDGAALRIVAKDIRFDKACLAAPAGAAITLALDNQDSFQHNLAIVQGGTARFTGEIFAGVKTVTYDVGVLEAGTYQFRCDIHPGPMHGTFVVR